MSLSPLGTRSLGRLPARRLVVVFALLTALPLALLTSFSIRIASQGLQREVEARLSSSAALASVAIRNEMEGLSELASSYASRPALIAALNPKLSEHARLRLLRPHLKELKRSRPGIATAFLADPSGKLVDIVPPTPSIVGQDFSFRDWYRGVTFTEGPYVSGAYISQVTGHPAVVAAAALVAPAAKSRRSPTNPRGIIVAAYRLYPLQHFVDRFASSQNVTLGVTDQRGVVVALAGQRPNRLMSRRADPLISAALHGRSGVRTVEAARGSLLAAFAPVARLGWTVTATVPTREALAPVRRVRSSLLGLAGIVGVILLAGLGLIVRMLEHLRRATEAGQLLQAIVESSEDAIIGKAVDGTIFSWNRGAEHIYGYTAEEAIGRPISMLAPADRRSEILEILDRVKRGELVRNFETLRARKDGTLVQMALTVSPIRDVNGGIIGASTIARDITERNRAEAERDQFFSLSLDLVAVAGFDGYFRQLNPVWEATLGWTLNELKARPYMEFVHPDDRKTTVAEAAALATGSTTASFENRYLCKDGSYRWLLWSAAASMEQHLIYAVARDVTERRRAEDELHAAKEEAELAKEEAERANQAKSEFLSRMSHELRTPLNAVLGYGQLLEMDHLDEDQRESVHQILKGGTLLLDLINEVLDIARIESGRMALSLEPIEVQDAIKEALDLIRPLATERGVSITVEGTSERPQFVLADRQRLKQILLNLLSNAVKFSRPGGAVVLRCRDVGEGVRIEVADQGAGISASHLDRLFTPFERLKADAAGVTGTGLGLALSKRLAEVMGGTIEVKSKEGVGSTFSIQLPKASVARFDKEAMTVEWAETTQQNEETTMLQIEDNPSNIRLVERILSGRPNSRLITAMQGSLGLELARQHSPDLILLDLNLPDVTGYDVLRDLRTDPRLADIPVVVISADATKGQMDRVLAAGAHSYLTKPLDVQRFMEVVNQALNSRRHVGGSFERGNEGGG